MIDQYVKDNLKNSLDALMVHIDNNSSNILMTEHKIKSLEFITQMNYLFNMGKLTSLEFESIHNMLLSPDTENHYIAKLAIEKKLIDIKYSDLIPILLYTILPF